MRLGVIPVLHKGDSGKFVRWAQVLLNIHHASTPLLKPDQLFGPKMFEAVVNFQKSSSLAQDGIVGPQTWLKLQLIAAELAHFIPAARAVVMVAPTAPKGPVSVADWSLTRRFREVVTKLTAKHLIGKTRAEFEALLTPLNIGILVTTLVAWAVSHAFGVGEIADAVAAVLGVFFLGVGVFRAAYALGSCMERTINAEVYSDLDAAGAQLAKAIAILGVTAFFMLVGRLAGKAVKRALPNGKQPTPEVGQDEPPPESTKENSSKKSEPNEADPAAARQARLQELAKDPSHGGKVSPKSLQEAEVGLASEENGKIPGPITRDPSGAAEFIDGNGQPWDVKGFNSNFPPEKGGFDLSTDLGKVQNEVGGGENVIVDTTKMSPPDVQSLQTGVQNAGIGDNVVWYP